MGTGQVLSTRRPFGNLSGTDRLALRDRQRPFEPRDRIGAFLFEMVAGSWRVGGKNQDWRCNLQIGWRYRVAVTRGREEGSWYNMLTFIIIPTVYAMNDEKRKSRRRSCCTRPAAAKKRTPKQLMNEHHPMSSCRFESAATQPTRPMQLYVKPPMIPYVYRTIFVSRKRNIQTE